VATILIVDDEDPVRELVALLLQDDGYQTLQAIHGAQALELTANDPRTW
jgi:CheY-like chemotaxis protein